MGRAVYAVQRKVKANLAEMQSTHPLKDSLEAMCLALAKVLDDGPGLAAPSANRELRANLLELARMAVSDDDPLDAALSWDDGPAPDRDAAPAGAADAGR